jgi:hypothetical protein
MAGIPVSGHLAGNRMRSGTLSGLRCEINAEGQDQRLMGERLRILLTSGHYADYVPLPTSSPDP